MRVLFVEFKEQEQVEIHQQELSPILMLIIQNLPLPKCRCLLFIARSCLSYFLIPLFIILAYFLKIIHYHQ